MRVPELESGSSVVLLPGTHTKWVRIQDGQLISFHTSMSGELTDRVREKGLLSSVVTTEAYIGRAFFSALDDIQADPAAFSRLLFGIRARVVLGQMKPEDAGSRLRGLLIGAEIKDGIARYPEISAQEKTYLVGNSALCDLYSAALARLGIRAQKPNLQDAIVGGFLALYERVRSA